MNLTTLDSMVLGIGPGAKHPAPGPIKLASRRLLQRLAPFWIDAFDLLHLTDVSVQFDMQFGQPMIAPSQYFEMLWLSAWLPQRLKAGVTRRPDCIAWFGMRMVMVRLLLVLDGNRRLSLSG